MLEYRLIGGVGMVLAIWSHERKRLYPAVSAIVACAVFAGMLFFLLHYQTDVAIMRCKQDASVAGSSAPCYKKLILDTYARSGLPSAIALVQKISDEDPLFQAYCHTTMHNLGRTAYTSFHRTKELDITEGLSYCNYGFYHAFMEQMLVQSGGVAEAKDFCELVGRKLNSRSAVSNCYHGIGHGLSSEPLSLDDPVKMAAPGLAVCRSIATESDIERSCAMGVFNSIELLYGNPRYRLSYPASPFDLCNSNRYSDNEKKACYLEMSVLAGDMSKGIFSTALSYTASVPVEYQSYAVSYIALYWHSGAAYDPQAVIDGCRNILPDFIDACIIGVAREMKVYGPPGNIYGPVIAFYKRTTLAPADKALFLSTILGADVQGTAEQQSVCEQFPPEMRRAPPCSH